MVAIPSPGFGRLRLLPLDTCRSGEPATAPAVAAAWFTEYDDFFRARARGLMRLARLQLQDDHAAEDVVAEVLVKVSSKWRRIRAMDAPDAYVRKMLINQCISHQRRPSTRYERQTEPAEIPDVPFSDHGNAMAERDRMWRLLGRLSSKQRAVLVLRHYEQLSDDEIGRILDISNATVRSHAFHALRKLRAWVESDGES